MILTDREWLRYVTFALVAGGVLGASYTGALAMLGHTAWWAVAGGVIATGVIALIAHLAIRYILDRATDPPSDTGTDADAGSTEPTTDSDTSDS